MNDFTEIVLTALITILIISFLIFISMFCIYKYTVEIGEANIVKVMVEGQIIFEGKKAFVKIDSGGMTTTVTLYKKLFPFLIIGKIYSNKDIKIR